MGRRRKDAIPLVVDVDGIEVHATLRPQRTKSGNWNVRWEQGGKPREVSTRTQSAEEAKKVARALIRGEDPWASVGVGGGLTVEEFEEIQKDYHRLNARPEAGESTLKDFLGIWKSFLRVCPVSTVQEVTEQVALKYLRCLQGMSNIENRRCKKKAGKKLSVKTIQKHIRTLAGAWNRVREGDPARVGGLERHQLVQFNPWQGIRNNIPRAADDDGDPVQFELEDNDLGRFLDQFKNHPVGELFIITSLWCWGRIKEMTRIEWSWLQSEYVSFPKSKTKGGRGKVSRLPPAILDRLRAIRDPECPYVFARWVDDVRQNAGRPTRVQPFDPHRMRGQMEKLIPIFAAAIGRPEISHHALRRTAMELGEEAELRLAEKSSAEKLQTTVGNKRKNYTKKLGKKARTFADGLYNNLTVAIHDFPQLAQRLGCEAREVLAERKARNEMQGLTPLQRQRVLKSCQDADASGEGQVVA